MSCVYAKVITVGTLNSAGMDIYGCHRWESELPKHGELKIADLTVWARLAGSHTDVLCGPAGLRSSRDTMVIRERRDRQLFKILYYEVINSHTKPGFSAAGWHKIQILGFC